MRTLIALALALVAKPVAAETVDQVAVRYKLAGEVLVAKGDKTLLDRGYGTIAPTGGAPHKAGERWRLASITKQVTAALIVRNEPSIDVSVGYPTDGDTAKTLRQLLTHHSGLPNPDATPLAPDGVPAFYKRLGDPAYRGYCVSTPAKPDAAFSYNNCDYLVAATPPQLMANGIKPLLWPIGMTMARAREKGVPGFVGGKPEPEFELAIWGAAGGLMGTARAVFDFDRSLTTGKLLSPAALAELWKPEGHGSYQALGQWVFPGQLKGCAKPKRIVQRDGEIYGVQTRNYILPDDDLVVIVFTNRSSDDFPIGEVWEQKGFAYDLLSAAACP